ncbi:hypothetical protein [Paenibacillus sp. NPDC057967]|uniref:hypothetical protein n=1 Tax=Paenibacillus sp. NPDC057967 TaxID=3346293 RepID=UPI0036D77E19
MKIIRLIIAASLILTTAACSNANNNGKSEPVNSPAATESAKPEESPVATESAPPADNDSEAKSGLITKEQYAKIESGMTYEEIIEIVGSEGEVMAESGKKGSDLYVFVVMYEGSGELGASASFSFLGEELQSKAQFGLE